MASKALSFRAGKVHRVPVSQARGTGLSEETWSLVPALPQSAHVLQGMSPCRDSTLCSIYEGSSLRLITEVPNYTRSPRKGTTHGDHYLVPFPLTFRFPHRSLSSLSPSFRLEQSHSEPTNPRTALRTCELKQEGRDSL